MYILHRLQPFQLPYPLTHTHTAHHQSSHAPTLQLEGIRRREVESLTVQLSATRELLDAAKAGAEAANARETSRSAELSELVSSAHARRVRMRVVRRSL